MLKIEDESYLESNIELCSLLLVDIVVCSPPMLSRSEWCGAAVQATREGMFHTVEFRDQKLEVLVPCTTSSIRYINGVYHGVAAVFTR